MSRSAVHESPPRPQPARRARSGRHRLASRAAALGLLLLPSAGVVSGAPPPAAQASPPPALDLAALAAQSRTVAIDEDRLRAALVKGRPEAVVFSTPLDLGAGRIAIAWSECNQTGCRGSVATLTGGAERPTLEKKAALVAPARVFFADGFAFEAPAVADLDGDGVPEVILRYRASEPPRAALGSLSHEFVAVHSAADLTLLFAHELRRAGADSEESCQWTVGRSGDRLTINGICNERACLESRPPAARCQPNRKILETWRKARGQKRYVRVAPRP